MHRFIRVVAVVLVAGCGSNPADVPQDAAVPRDAPADTAFPSGHPILAIDPPSFDFGEVATGTSANPTTFTVRNTGDGTSGTLLVKDVQAPFSRDAGTCTGALAVGQTCTFTVGYTPTTLAHSVGGAVVSDPSGIAAAASVYGTGVTPDGLTFSIAGHDFGTVVLGAADPTFTFTVRNNAIVTTGAIAVAIHGADLGAFSQTNTCTTLAPLATCTITVTLATTAAGTKSAMLDVSAAPGGTRSAPLAAVIQTPAALAVTAQTSASFNDVVVGGIADRTFVVSNSGAQTSGAIAIHLTGADYSVLGNTVGDCVDGTTTLASNATCNVRVRFQPTATGSRPATLGVSASPGGSASVTLTGTGLAPGQLSSATTTHDFGAVEKGTPTDTFTWTITNTGGVVTGGLTLSNNNATEVSVSNNTCTVPLAPAASCSIDVTFRPNPGVRTGTLTLTGAPGGSVSLAVTAEGRLRLTVFTAGTGTVTAPGIVCGTGGTDCTELVAYNSVVTLSARPANGSGSRFSFWQGPCNDGFFDCTITVTNTVGVIATFTSIAGNAAFVSSALVPSNLGSAAAYDDQCNALATAAGINDLAGTSFRAWISDATSNAVTRIGDTTGGWRTLDGRVFARSMTDLLNLRVLNMLTITEQGATVTSGGVWTATNDDGTARANSCTNWTDTSGSADAGSVFGGPGLWTNYAAASCSVPRRLYCLQTSSTTALPTTLPPPDAKIIYYAEGFTPGSGISGADAYCNGHKPPVYSTRTFRALLVTSTQRLSDIVTDATSYYRPDGILVGTGANLRAGTPRSGIWQHYDGTYHSGPVMAWSGASGSSTYGTVISSCNNWTYNDPGATGQRGMVNRSDSPAWWSAGLATPCNTTAALYCVER